MSDTPNTTNAARQAHAEIMQLVERAAPCPCPGDADKIRIAEIAEQTDDQGVIARCILANRANIRALWDSLEIVTEVVGLVMADMPNGGGRSIIQRWEAAHVDRESTS